MLISLNLKPWRNLRKLTQTDVACSLDMTLNNYQKIEAGEIHSISLENLGKLCDLFDCEIADLFVTR